MVPGEKKLPYFLYIIIEEKFKFIEIFFDIRNAEIHNMNEFPIQIFSHQEQHFKMTMVALFLKNTRALSSSHSKLKWHIKHTWQAGFNTDVYRDSGLELAPPQGHPPCFPVLSSPVGCTLHWVVP